MIIFKQADPLIKNLGRHRAEGKIIGLVPTMGALHEGHISLISEARKKNDLTVCTIFINPTQFNNSEDFKRYPVTIEKDVEQLVRSGCEVLFLPAVEEIYPEGYKKVHYDLGSIEQRLEGLFRPGHFQGVCQVVDRLLGIIEPANLYLGQKDYQQCIVIRKLLELTGRDTKVNLHIVPTIREAGGLAMSSRNLRLSAEEKMLAASIFEELSMIRQKIKTFPARQLTQEARSHLEKKGFRVDYVEIADARDLSPVDGETPQSSVALIAASIGDVRLIDNLVLN